MYVTAVQAVYVRGIHSFICKKAPGKIMRHQALNDLIARSFSAADVPVTKEPSGPLRSDGKRPDGLSLVPWQSGKAVCWDVTVICPLADSYISDSAHEPGSVAELAASRKEAKYAVLDGRYMFVPIACKNLGVPNASAKLLLTHLGYLRSLKNVARHPFCFRDAQYYFSVLTLFFCMIVCLLVTAWNFRHNQPFHFH